MDGMTQTGTGTLPLGHSAPPPKRRRWVTVLLCVLAAAGLVYVVWFWPKSTATHDNHAGQTPLAVVAQPASRADVPIWLDGLGTVQAYNTVTVHSQIDGPLLEVRFREGQDVARGDILATIDPRPYQATLDQMTAKKAQDEALLANARLDFARYQKLTAQNYTSTQTTDTARATVAQDEALVRSDQAQIDSAKTQLSYTVIQSPIDGRAGVRNVDAGNIIRSSDSTGLVTITQLRPIYVVFTLPQQALPQVSRAMAQGAAAVEAVRPTNGAPVTDDLVLDRGTLAVLDNQVDTSTGTIKLKASFPNQDLRLWPGGFVDVRLRVATETGVVTVAPGAIQRGPRGAFVYVVQDGAAKMRPVTVGHEDAAASVITQGVDAGETVVTDGGSRITDGRRVAVAQPDGLAPDAAVAPSAPGTERRSHRGS